MTKKPKDSKVVLMNPTLYRKIKMLAAYTDRDVKDIVDIAVSEYLDKNYPNINKIKFNK
jgi:hypothetical protein